MSAASGRFRAGISTSCPVPAAASQRTYGYWDGDKDASQPPYMSVRLDLDVLESERRGK